MYSFNLSNLVIAWDLDATLIDSSQRHRYNENGDFDLDYWIEHAHKEEYVNKDTLLPLFGVYDSFRRAGYSQICVTARVMSPADYKYLEDHGLYFDKILHRGDSLELDHLLKSKSLQDYFNADGKIPFMAFDDKQENLEVFDKFGFRTFHAEYLNRKISLDGSTMNSYGDIDFSPADFLEG